MATEKRIASFFRDSLRIPELIARFPDIRKHPRIPLQNILSSLLLMPFWGATSLLSLDRLSRKRQVKGLFGCQRKLVVSDTTIARVLGWVDEATPQQALLSLAPRLKLIECLQRRLVADRPLTTAGHH